MKLPLIKYLSTLFVILSCVGCKPNNDPAARHAEAAVIVKRLVARDAEHPMHSDLKFSRDKNADTQVRAGATERTKKNCEDLVKLRSLIDVGRPLGDYAPVEKIGRFIGGTPPRFFLCGLTGFVNDQGPEPYSIMIDIDSSNTILKVGPIVAAH